MPLFICVWYIEINWVFSFIRIRQTEICIWYLSVTHEYHQVTVLGRFVRVVRYQAYMFSIGVQGFINNKVKWWDTYSCIPYIYHFNCVPTTRILFNFGPVILSSDVIKCCDTCKKLDTFEQHAAWKIFGDLLWINK